LALDARWEGVAIGPGDVARATAFRVARARVVVGEIVAMASSLIAVKL